MALSNWEVFGWLFSLRGDHDAEAAEGEDPNSEDDGWFVPSPLDLSVRSAHGSGDEEQVRELSRIQAQAREIEEQSGH